MEQSKKPIILTELERKYLIDRIKKNSLNNKEYMDHVEGKLAETKNSMENNKKKS